MTRTSDDPVPAGREAFDRHAWAEAYDLLSEADRAGPLTGAGLQLLAEAAYWVGHPDETVELVERAFGAYLAEGDRASASMAAFRVAEQHGMRGEMSQALGWSARAGRLAEENADWPVHGWLAWMGGLIAWFQSQFESAIDAYDRALEHASRTGDRDLYWMTFHDKGHALCLLGRMDEGVSMLDEAMAAVVGGELTPGVAGYVYCGMIGICSKLGDYGRAAEWTEATLRWCERESVPAFPGVCRIHKAELMLIHGSLEQAEEEARLACEELPQFNLTWGMGPANYAIGEVRRRLGDVRGAEEAYTKAGELGFTPQPGLSLLRLGQGRLDAAAAGVRQALADAGDNRCLRVRLLAAQAQIAITAGDAETAAAAAEELDATVTVYQATALRALAAYVRGSLRLAQGDPSAALAELRLAQRGWQEVDAPFEVAETRLVMGKALRALGDDETAILEWGAARAAFERVGARPDAEVAGTLLAEVSVPTPATDRVTRAFMFTDIVKSTDLVGVIGDEAWEELLAWHDQTLRSLFASHGGGVAHHTGDGFFVAFEDPRSAVSCAMAVQRALAEHRRLHGFAPLVRMGVHAGEATRRGQDFSGREVHKAARIAALAEGGEILVTAAVVEGLDGSEPVVRLSDPWTVTVKGVVEPLEVVRIEWR